MNWLEEYEVEKFSDSKINRSRAVSSPFERRTIEQAQESEDKRTVIEFFRTIKFRRPGSYRSTTFYFGFYYPRACWIVMMRFYIGDQLLYLSESSSADEGLVKAVKNLKMRHRYSCNEHYRKTLDRMGIKLEPGPVHATKYPDFSCLYGNDKPGGNYRDSQLRKWADRAGGKDEIGHKPLQKRLPCYNLGEDFY